MPKPTELATPGRYRPLPLTTASVILAAAGLLHPPPHPSHAPAHCGPARRRGPAAPPNRGPRSTVAPAQSRPPCDARQLPADSCRRARMPQTQTDRDMHLECHLCTRPMPTIVVHGANRTSHYYAACQLCWNTMTGSTFLRGKPNTPASDTKYSRTSELEAVESTVTTEPTVKPFERSAAVAHTVVVPKSGTTTQSATGLKTHIRRCKSVVRSWARAVGEGRGQGGCRLTAHIRGSLSHK